MNSLFRHFQSQCFLSLDFIISSLDLLSQLRILLRNAFCCKRSDAISFDFVISASSIIRSLFSDANDRKWALPCFIMPVPFLFDPLSFLLISLLISVFSGKWSEELESSFFFVFCFVILLVRRVDLLLKSLFLRIPAVSHWNPSADSVLWFRFFELQFNTLFFVF